MEQSYPLRFGYTGQTWIAELGLWHYKARMYSPTLGRFLQTDPVGYEDQINLYAYVGNDPVNMVDPSGKVKISANLEAQVVIIAGAKVSAGVYIDTKTLEVGATISGGPRIGLEGGTSIAVGISESSSSPAENGTKNTATVDSSISIGLGYAKEIISEDGSINTITDGNSGSASVDIGKLGLSAGASIGVNFTGTASTDAVKKADEVLSKAQGVMDATAARAATGMNQICQTSSGTAC